MSLQSSLAVAVRGVESATLDLGSASATVSKTWGVTLATGTGVGQADVLWSDTRTLAASGTEDLDLAGALVGALGAAAAFARVKGIALEAAESNTHNVVVGGAAENAWAALFGADADTLVLRPGAAVAVIAGETDATGYAVTAGTGDLLQVANSGAVTPVTYSIIVIGASA